MIPTDKRAQLIRYQDMFTASHINKSSRSYEVRKSYNNQTNRYAGTVSFLLKQNIKNCGGVAVLLFAIVSLFYRLNYLAFCPVELFWLV